MDTLIIKRSEWYRGHGSYESRLIRELDGLKCCLGFECLSRGIEYRNLIGRTIPSRLGISVGNLSGLVSSDPDDHDEPTFINLVVWANDTPRHTPMPIELHEIMPVDLPVNVPIVDDPLVLTSEDDRERLITLLFKYYLNRDVVFEA